MAKSDDEILKIWLMYKSVHQCILRTGYSWNRVVKSLSSCGVIINENHQVILKMYMDGYSIEEISQAVKLSRKTIQSYIPRVRPIYGEDMSENAKRIRKYRAYKGGQI